MDRHSFRENFNQNKQPHETSLSFEVELLEGDSWVRVDEFTGFLRNEVTERSRQDLPKLGYLGESFQCTWGVQKATHLWSQQLL